MGVQSRGRSDIGSREALAGWHPDAMDHAEVLLIGGRAGVGKTSVGWEVSAQLRAAAVSHAVIEGDFMGQVHPEPEGDPDRSEITESNLTAVWANFTRRGYRRLIYTNTASVLPEATGMFERAMGQGCRSYGSCSPRRTPPPASAWWAESSARSWSWSWRAVSARRGSWTSGSPRKPCGWQLTVGQLRTLRARW